MDTADRMVRRKSLSERLGLKGISCCGATWGLLMTNNITDGQEGSGGGNEREIETIDIGQTAEPVPACLDQTPATVASGMNLAAALAAERNYRAGQDNSYGNREGADSSPVRPDMEEEISNGSGTGTNPPGTPFRVSLMKLLQETDGSDRAVEKDGVGVGGVGCDSVCCVCMVRKRGAAFIPCGHTFCRVCSRELWVNRGFCPLCNRSIIEILDIF